jgi:DNA-directed RNA polymerase specialized sigma24 family protein
MNIDNLVIRNYNWLLAKARKLCYDDYEAEDLVADTVLRILESRSRFDSQREFRPWAQTVLP